MNTTNHCRWDSRKTFHFVTEYKKQACLWNMSSTLYRDKGARRRAYLDLVQVVGLPGFSVADVKNKIKNLRSTYYQEVRKIKESLTRGSEMYTPSIIWFYEMDSFIGEVSTFGAPDIPMALKKDLQVKCEPPEDCPAAEEVSTTQCMVEGNSVKSEEYVNEELLLEDFEDEDTNTLTENMVDSSNNHIGPSTSLCLLNNRKRRADVSCAVSARPVGSGYGDEFHSFSMNVADQLRQLPLERALKIQMKIQTMIAKERITVQMQLRNSNCALHQNPHRSFSPLSGEDFT